MAKKQYIGDKQIISFKKLDETTPGGVPLIEVKYADDTVEVLSKLMFDHTVSDKGTDLTELRMKRVSRVVELTLELCRDWGIKIGETPFFGQLLNASLNDAVDQAELQLWSQWMTKPKERDEVSLTTVDRVLRTIRPTLKEITGNGTKD